MTTSKTKPEPLLTTQQAAEYLALEPRQLQTRYRLWKIPAYKVGKYLRFRQSELDAWLAEHTERPLP